MGMAGEVAAAGRVAERAGRKKANRREAGVKRFFGTGGKRLWGRGKGSMLGGD